MAEYKIELEKLKKAGIKPEVGTELSIGLKDGATVAAKITKVEKQFATATTK